MKNIKVIINPAGNILYTSYYIYGLERLFGSNAVCYSSTPFLQLSPSLQNGWNMLFVIVNGLETKRYFISCNDSFAIIPEAYEWADVYGSVNVNWAKTDKKYWGKLVSLCPSFAIRCWSAPKTIWHAVTDYRMSCGSLRKFLGKHKRLLQRVSLSEYICPPPPPISLKYTDNQLYIYFVSTLWYSDNYNHNDEGVNMRRANFIRACHRIEGILFEGGLVAQSGGRSSVGSFSDCLGKGVGMKEWINRTTRSDVVFNTPAFWDCHGWKLGEYLAMGKCIMSTSLSNDLPSPLVHGEHIHFVENSEEAMSEALVYLQNHPEYRHRLEQGARAYWDEWGTPEASLKLLGIK